MSGSTGVSEPIPGATDVAAGSGAGARSRGAGAATIGPTVGLPPETAVGGNGAAPPTDTSRTAGGGGSRPVRSIPDQLWGILQVLLAVLAGVAVAFIVISKVTRGPIETTRAGEVESWTEMQWGWLALAAVLYVAALVLVMNGVRALAGAKSRVAGSFQQSLLSSALFDLTVAAAVTVGISIFTDGLAEASWWNEIAVAAGFAAALVAAMAYSIVQRQKAWPSRVNPWQYGELSERWDHLDAQIGQICIAPPALAFPVNGCAEAKAHRDFVAGALGIQRGPARDEPENGPLGEGELELAPSPDGSLSRPFGSADKWTLGIGFVELWQRLHAADAALYPMRSRELVVADGLVDELRILGSGMKNEDALLTRLRHALVVLGGKAHLSREAAALFDDVKDDAVAQMEARYVLASIRRNIDEFRDQSRAGLARTRNHLMWTGVVTALAAYALLVLAVLGGVSRGELVAGITFFLVGAVTGLVWQLRSSGSEIRSGEDDFGLDTARLVYTPVLSGLAGVGGVLIMAMLYPTLNVALNPADTGATTVTVPEFGDIFSLTANRFGLVVAAVFGLTPDLLINRLQGQADRFKTDLQNTSVQTRSGGVFTNT